MGGKRPPQFYMPSYEAEIPESQRKDSDIISVKAKSFADREIRYTLKAQGQGAGTFNIGPSSGIVKLAKELDFEDLRQPHIYQLLVTATEDSGGFSTSVELTIRVSDVNDNAPKFELPDSQATRLEGKVTTASRQPYGPITLYGQWPLSSWTLTCQPDREETLPNATFREAKMTCSYAMA